MPGCDAPRAARSTVRRPLFARFYERLSVNADAHAGVRENRTELLAGLTGHVVEIGAGNGLNFARYPAGVTRVTAVEPEPRLRASALAAASGGGVRPRVEVVDATAEALPVADGACDAAVFSLVMCSLPDVPRALAEALRVLRPGGELRFFEHERARDRPGMARLQRAVDATVWPLFFGGCHTSRDPVGAIGAAGFTDVSFRRLMIPPGGPTAPSSFHVLGGARRP